MVEKVTDSFLNWGFNPSLIKGEYFLLSSSSTDNDEFPVAITSQSFILAGDELIKFWNTGKLIRNGESVLGLYNFGKSRYVRILGYYEERAMEEGEECINGLHSLIKEIQEFDINKWVKNFKKRDHTYVEWNRNKDDDWAENVEFADFSVNYNYIAIDIRENYEHMTPWATKFLIKRVKM